VEIRSPVTFESFFFSLIVDAVRQGAWTSMIIVEMATLTVIWPLWVATASVSASQSSPTALSTISVFTFCSGYTDIDSSLSTACSEFKAVEAMSFLAFITLLIYTFLLLVFTLIASARGHSIWTKPVKGTNFFAPSVNPPEEPAPQMAAAQYPPNFAPQPQMYAPGAVPQPIYPGYQPGSPMPQFTGAPMMTPQFTGTPMMAPQLTGSPMMTAQPGLPMQAPQPGVPYQGPPAGGYQTPPPGQV
jgi:hypothetical protein